MQPWKTCVLWILIREIRHLWYYYFYKSTSRLKSTNRNSLNGFIYFILLFSTDISKRFYSEMKFAPYVKLNKNVIYEVREITLADFIDSSFISVT